MKISKHKVGHFPILLYLLSFKWYRIDHFRAFPNLIVLLCWLKNRKDLHSCWSFNRKDLHSTRVVSNTRELISNTDTVMTGIRAGTATLQQLSVPDNKLDLRLSQMEPRGCKKKKIKFPLSPVALSGQDWR